MLVFTGFRELLGLGKACGTTDAKGDTSEK
jgi:hypothetical protein